VSYSVVVVSDLHVGGRFALFPRGFRTSNDVLWPLNRGQDYLLECWENALARLPSEIDVLVFNGDIVEGRNKFVMGLNIIEPDPLWQVRAAAQVTEPLVRRARQIRCTQGSCYHVGKGGAYSELFAERVGAKPRQGHYVIPWWRFWFHGVYFDFAHRQSVMFRYRSTAMEREIEFFITRIGKKNKAPPRHVVITRSHTHVGFKAWWDSNTRVSVSTPSMKLQDIYAQTSISPERIIPENLGIVCYEVYDEPQEGGSKVRIIPLLYEHPEEENVETIE
jgi:hypothetical protein